MHYRTLGRTGLRVSLLSYGSGGPSLLGQRTGLTPGEQDALIRRCLDSGINYIDTAILYRESEAILGRALDGVPRDSYILSTKWEPANDNGLLGGPRDFIDAVEGSLRRLRTDQLDILFLHGVPPAHYAAAVERFHPTMERLREQGKARFLGVTERFHMDSDHLMAAEAVARHPGLWDAIMLKYGILNQWAAREILPAAMKHGIGLINMAAVRVKLTRPDQLEELMREWKQRGLIPPDSLPDADPLGWLAGDGVESVVAAGYKFAVDHPAVHTVLTGASSTKHLEENVRALENPTLPGEHKRRLGDLFGNLREPY